jgi:glucose-1-phosphate thymidylyltransferase
MKGVILAGGLGTRLMPLTKVTNKHLLPIGEYPMLYYSIDRLIDAGILEIMIVVGVEHCGDIMRLLGSGEEFGCSFTYKVQDKPDGIAGALKLCKNFVGDSKFAVILGDNIFEDSIKDPVCNFKKSNDNCMLFFKEVENPSRFGVGVFKNKKLISVVEKPAIPPTNYACVGIYFYSQKVFDILEKTRRSKRGEYEISDVNSYFLEKKDASHVFLEGIWTDAGTFDSYRKTNSIVADKKFINRISTFK